jgi:hypothetical protein
MSSTNTSNTSNSIPSFDERRAVAQEVTRLAINKAQVADRQVSYRSDLSI